MKNKYELEIYACIDGFPDYLVTSKGRVLSLKGNNIKELKPFKDKDGYYRVNLYKKGKRKHILVHRLVAQAFISNPNNKPCVNHIDENKTNNCVSNLEWMTCKENTNYGTGIDRRSITHSITMSDGRMKGIKNPNHKSVIGINKKTNDIKIYHYIRECENDGFDTSHIVKCCKGKIKTHKGYTWKYYNGEMFENTEKDNVEI